MIDRRRLEFTSPYDKARWLAGQARLDALLGPVQRKAEELHAMGDTPLNRAEKAFRFVRDEIRYVRDPPPEQFADSAVILQRRFDDCDGKARLFCALITALEHLVPMQMEVELVPVFPAKDWFAHVCAQIRWPHSYLHPRANTAGWIRAETVLRGVELGQGSEHAQRDARGQILYS